MRKKGKKIERDYNMRIKKILKTCKLCGKEFYGENDNENKICFHCYQKWNAR